MNRRNRLRPSLEKLEHRMPLALDLHFDGAGRLIRIAEDAAGQGGAVSLLVDSAGKVQVNDGGSDLGSYDVGRNLSISLGNVTPGKVNVLQLDGHTLKTNLEVTLGDQDPSAPPTQFRILGGRVDQAGVGRIDGHVTEKAGTGDQFFLFGEQGKAIAHVTEITGSLRVDVGPGGEAGGAPEPVGSVGTPPSPALLHVRGDVVVRNSTIFVIAGSVGGNLTVESPDKVGTIPFLGSPGQLVTLGNFGRPLSVGGQVRVQTGGGADSISTENATLNKSLVIASGAGDDYLQMGNIDPANDPGNSDFIYAPASVRHNVFLHLGAGNDRVDLGADDGIRTVAFHVGGNLFIDGGQGDDTINVIDLQLDQSVIRLETGDGNDTITLRRVDAPRAHLFALLGRGDDTLAVDNAATLALKSLKADGGDGADDLELGNLNTFSFRRRLRGF